MIATEPKQRTTSHPARVFLAVFYQEPTAGTLASCPGWLHAVQIHFEAPEGVLSAFYASTGNSSLLTFQALYAPIERARKAYITAVTIQAKRQKQLIQTTETTNRPGSGQIFISIFCHFIPLFWCQKPLGCVSIFQKSKILKSLTGEVPKRKFFK
jgi:hypothetical protein